MRTRISDFTLYALKSRNVTKIDTLFVKTETNTSPIGEFFLLFAIYHLVWNTKCTRHTGTIKKFNSIYKKKKYRTTGMNNYYSGIYEITSENLPIDKCTSTKDMIDPFLHMG